LAVTRNGAVQISFAANPQYRGDDSSRSLGIQADESLREEVVDVEADAPGRRAPTDCIFCAAP
jgi:hypothetical protein